MVDNADQIKFSKFLSDWINNKISEELKSLINLKKINVSNTSIRALAYQLYENNGVIKRENVKNFLKNLGQDERKILRSMGVKFGRYHIFLFKLFKPNSVSLRIALWKNFHQKYFNLKPPTFGLNFIIKKNTDNENFMLLCGFEKINNFFVRIDILERLFINIMNLHTKNNSEIKLIPEMLNLLGCNKESFIQLIKSLKYRVKEIDGDVFFKYLPPKNVKNNKSYIKNEKENPFNILKQMNLK